MFDDLFWERGAMNGWIQPFSKGFLTFVAGVDKHNPDTMVTFLKKVCRRIWRELQRFPRLLFVEPICLIRSILLTCRIDEGGGRFVLTDPFMNIRIEKKKGSRLVVQGKITIVRFLHGRNPILISMSEHAEMHVNGDFILGQGVRFRLDRNAVLIIGGKDQESGSGITADALIMVRKRLEIGKDFMAGWNLYITDCDWHQIVGQEVQKDVLIGHHVWVANQCNILKGSMIGDGCIVASCSRTSGKTYGSNLLIGGIPAKVLKTDVAWKRDLNG